MKNIFDRWIRPKEESLSKEMKDTLVKARELIGGKVDVFLGSIEENKRNGIYTGETVKEVDKKTGVITLTRDVGVLEDGVGPDKNGVTVVESKTRMPINAMPLKISCEMRTSADGRKVLIFSTTGDMKLIQAGKGGWGDRLSVAGGENFYSYVGAGVVTEKCFVDVETGYVGRVWTAIMKMDPSENVERQLGRDVTISYDANDLARNLTGEPMAIRKVEQGVEGKIMVSDGFYFGPERGFVYTATSEVS